VAVELVLERCRRPVAAVATRRIGLVRRVEGLGRAGEEVLDLLLGAAVVEQLLELGDVLPGELGVLDGDVRRRDRP
jgi:hypothetical protein